MVDALRADWTLAAGDAGVAAVDAKLRTATPLPGSHFGAMYYRPGMWPTGNQHPFAYSNDELTALYNLRDEHVIVVANEGSAELRLLKLRHEAEHVAQQVGCPGAMELAERVASALPDEMWYQVLPHERRANRASTVFAGANGFAAPPGIDDSTDRFLYGAPWREEDLADLPVQLVAFSLFVVDGYERACRAPQDADATDPLEVLERALPGVAAIWRDLRGDYADVMERTIRNVFPAQDADIWNQLPLADRLALRDRMRFTLLDVESEIVLRLRERLA